MTESNRMRVTIALALACTIACTKDKPKPTPSDPSEPSVPAAEAGVQPAPQPSIDAAPSTQPACDTLSRSKCLQSEHCTLELAGNNVYRCRADQGPCEVGVKQSDKNACEAKAECAWDGGSCYCPCEGAARTETVEEPQSGCACACGGGAPSMCIEKSKVTPKK